MTLNSPAEEHPRLLQIYLKRSSNIFRHLIQVEENREQIGTFLLEFLRFSRCCYVLPLIVPPCDIICGLVYMSDL